MGHWLHLCDQEHGGQCRKPFGLDSATFGYPKLLIDVHKKCIVEAEPSHRYACLSYVWGNVPTLKTTQDNLLDLKKQKSLETRGAEIPRTIRDTINLIDQLGLRYLWVDSLCIIQDDARTKHDQIQSMAGIYANSYVTIIAGNGWDANHGLRGLQGITEPRQLSSFLKTDFQENLQPYSSIWYSRGWTFQEMVFSPRKIMFQYQLATWECNEKSWHESSLSKVSTPMDISRFHPKVTPWKSKVEFTEWPDVKQYIELVRDYSMRKLTYNGDGLSAISSLLSVMSSSFKGGFISGLPEMFFHEALLWQPDEIMQRRQASEETSDLPSWSWAGWEGGIMLDDWLAHYSHLTTYWSRPEELVLDDGNPTRRDLDASRPVFQITPTVTWYFGNTINERIPITPSGDAHVKCLTDPFLPLPPGYSRTHFDKVLYKDKENTLSTYPLPIQTEKIQRIISARYIFCSTKRACYKSNKWSESGDGRVYFSAGSIITHLGAQRPLDDIYELVSISSGALSYGDGRHFWGGFSGMHTKPEGRRAPNPLSNTSEVHGDSKEFYYVMWIGRKGVIAYRKGLGRILKSSWEEHATEDYDLILG